MIKYNEDLLILKARAFHCTHENSAQIRKRSSLRNGKKGFILSENVIFPKARPFQCTDENSE